jgi:YYY domain-containing protein
VQALGIVGLPLAALLFARLPGGGLVFARPVALLAVAYPAWLLASIGAAPYGYASAGLGALLVTGTVGALTLRRAPIGLLARARGAAATMAGRLWIAGELLFASSFLLWAWLRSYSPDVWHTEKPMDMALVNATNRSDSFPPHDPWFAGERVNYYYFGHYLVAFLVRLTAVDPAVGFNLGVALFYALTLTAVFGVGSGLYLVTRRGAGSGRATVAGLVAVGLSMVLGNLEGARQLVLSGGRLAAYDWWAPSRVIPGTANEFPFFSFLLGDLHAHVMAMPFALVVVAVAVQLGASGPHPFVRRKGRSAFARALAGAGLAGLVTGSLYATNSLNFPPTALLVALALVIWARGSGLWRQAAAWGGVWLAASIVSFLPFFARFDPPARGVGIVAERELLPHFLAHTVLLYGVPLVVLAPFFAARLRSFAPRTLAWSALISALGLAVLTALHAPSLVVVVLALGLALHGVVVRGAGTAGQLVWLLVAAGVALALVGEVVYLRDEFDGTSAFRFNTVFKAGYQAWFLLTIPSACVLTWALGGAASRGLRRRAWLAAVGLVVLVALAYPLSASYSRSGAFATPPTLDGMRWLERRSSGDAAAIRWLRAHANGDETILEAVGPDFSPEGHARISVFTGLATVLGWAGHELQWGRSLGSRAADVDRIYSTTSAAEAAALLERYAVDYVVVGSLERTAYGEEALAKFDRIGEQVFAHARTVVYHVTPRSAAVSRRAWREAQG